MVAKYHPNDGFDYYPKKYHEYECVPVTNDLSVIDTDFPYQVKLNKIYTYLSMFRLTNFL